MAEENVEAQAEQHNGEPLADPDHWDRKRVAQSLVNRHSALAAGVGLVPATGFDALATSGVALTLMKRLSDTYEVQFSRQVGLNIFFTLLSGSVPLAFRGVTCSLLKMIPVVGNLASAATMPILTGSVVYAIGQTMIRHYEAGGDLLNFDARQARDYFQEQLAAAPQPA